MTHHTLSGRRRQRGIANVEFALVLPVIVLLAAFVLFFGRLFWHYTVALKAASDMATFVAQARVTEMIESRPDLGEIGIVRLARSIGETELASLNPGNGTRPVIDISCDAGVCRGDAIPDELVVMVKMQMYNSFLPLLLGKIADSDGMWLRAEVRVHYAGT